MNQQSIPGMPRPPRWRNFAEWFRDHLGRFDPHEVRARQYRDDAWSVVPHSLLPSADKLQRQWFDGQIRRILAETDIRIHDVVDAEGKVEKRFRDELQLSFDDVYPNWFGRYKLGKQDLSAVIKEIQDWLAHHPEHGQTLDEVVEQLELDAA